MKFTLKVVADVCVLKLDGKFMAIGNDFTFLREKVKNILGMGIQKLLVDMDKVPYIYSSGVGFLVSSHTSITQTGGQLKLVKVKPKVLKVLEVMKLLPIFEIFDEEEAAIKSFFSKKRSTGTPKRKKSVMAKKEKVSGSSRQPRKQ